MKIKIITDSTADITESFAKAYDITIAPLDVIFDGVAYKATELTNEEFYKRLNECLDQGLPLPTTSQVTEVAFEEILKPYANDPDTYVAVVTIAKEMSNTYYSAQKAIEALQMQNVHLFDTHQVTFGLGALVAELAKLAKRPNMTIEQFLIEGEDLNKRVWIYASIGDLRCLRAGGRLSAASMMLGSMLKLKPIIYVNHKVEVCAKCLGQSKATRWIADHVVAERDESLPLYLGGSQAPEILNEFRTKYRSALRLTGDEEEFPLGPVVGVHAGPGCAGIAFFRKKEQ